MQKILWKGVSIPHEANILHVVHALETKNTSRTAPSVHNVTVSGSIQTFGNYGWNDGHALFAIKDLNAFELSLVLDFNEDDSLIDTLSLQFEKWEGIVYTNCYVKEAMEVCRTAAAATSLTCQRNVLRWLLLSETAEEIVSVRLATCTAASQIFTLVGQPEQPSI
jgi:hypothetical protein